VGIRVMMFVDRFNGVLVLVLGLEFRGVSWSLGCWVGWDEKYRIR
jgi:hypothetical protein